MKKVVLFVVLLAVLALGAFAQVPSFVVGKTFVYYFVELVDTSTGERHGSSGTRGEQYITFSNASFLLKETRTVGREETYQFLREENGVYVFTSEIPKFSTYYCYFSKDFKRLNERRFSHNTIRIGWSQYIEVWDQTKPEPQPEPPMELY